MKRANVWLPGIVATLLAGCASTIPPLRAMNGEQKRQSLIMLHASDLKVATIAFRLAAAGNDICPVKVPLTGMTLHAETQYAPELRGILGLDDGVAVLAVVPESPADRAGLRTGDMLVTIGATRLPPARTSTKATYADVAAAYASLERAARAGPVSLQVERNGSIRSVILSPLSGCASRVQLLPSSRLEARADGTNLSITTAILAYARGDDELALVIAHEMAHNGLGHRALLQSQGVNLGIFRSARANAAQVLKVERAADRLGYYLMARGGFDLGVAPHFWERLYNGPAASRSKPTTHPAAAARIADARSVLDEIVRQRWNREPLAPH